MQLVEKYVVAAKLWAWLPLLLLLLSLLLLLLVVDLGMCGSGRHIQTSCHLGLD
jgi:hypothetical protein